MKKATLISIRTALFAVAASLSVIATAGSDSATQVTTTAEGLRTTTVSYADLDLGSAEAQDTLHRRFRRAALKVCGSPNRNTAGSLAQAEKNRDCAQNVVAEGMRTISTRQEVVAGR